MAFSTFQKTLVLITYTFLVSLYSVAQCPTCTPDLTCISTDGLPSVCPAVQPNGTAGTYYEEQLTFFMPATLTDPTSGALVTLIDITISSVSGLPYGLEFTLNDPDSTFHPSAGENYGCATICGVPLLPGNYTVVITITALVSAFGFEITQVQNFVSEMTINPVAGVVNSFTYDNIANCGGLDVNYAATIVAPPPSATTYSWNFGNGATSTLASPPTITYDTPGEYTATLTTVISNFVISSVSVSNLSNNWGGDVDDIFGSADPYFNIEDASGNALFSSVVVDNTTSTTWTNVNFTITNPPYSLHFFDDDLITADDDLGTTPINIVAGTTFFDVGNGTVGTINITSVEANQFTDSITVSVFPSPNAPLLQDGTTIYFADPTLETFTWYNNGIPISNVFDSSYTMTSGGLFSADVTNAFGCSGTSNSILYCPPIVVQYDAPAMELFVPDNFQSYQWSFNGLPVDGATTYYLPVTNSGNYTVATTTSYGCQTISSVYVLNLSIENFQNNASLILFPNPATDKIQIRDADGLSIQSVMIYDMMGRCIGKYKSIREGDFYTLQVAELAPGVYFADVNNNRIRFVKH